MAAAVPDVPPILGALIEARAQSPAFADKPFLFEAERSWTFREYRDACVRSAHFLRRRLGPSSDARPGHVAMLLDNRLELLSLYGGCGYAGCTLFGVNTGLRGSTLAGVLNQSQARVLVVEERLYPEVEKARAAFEHLAPENILVLKTGQGESGDAPDFLRAIESEVGAGSLEAPGVEVKTEQPLVVIYTSGTTGLPKGILNNHFKMFAVGVGISTNLGLDTGSVGYACMPLFHSNSLFIGFSPNLYVGGAMAMRDRFSASGFVPDVLRYGVTYWNYVGEPVHYILNALEKQYGGDEERILAEVARNPRNHLRYAIGNGASPPDIDRFARWLGLEDMFELYGSTEATISTFRKKGDPRGSVGEITDPAVKILDERGQECPPAQLSADGKILNYAQAVGEICRIAPETGLFQGYYQNPDANRSKYRDGVYHSGDLGHVLLQDGHRYLYFDGRTDDWIRKDGENFSAAQVARIVQEHPAVALAAAYGVPCTVSDELVMVALQLRPGAVFDPARFFAFCDEQVEHGGMDRKWFPDFVRIVDDFEFTQTQKILVRNLKRDHFHRERLPDAALYWRRRGDRAYRPFGKEDFAALRSEFERAERDGLLG